MYDIFLVLIEVIGEDYCAISKLVALHCVTQALKPET